MKNVKKLLSLIMALTMIMALAVSASAAPTGPFTITIKNSVSGAQYNVYKVFDVDYDETNSAYSYTITDANIKKADSDESDSAWVKAIKNSFTLAQSASDKSVWVATPKDTFDAAAFAADLKAADDKPSPSNKDALTGTGEDIVLNLDEAGYYFVTSTEGSLCNLTDADPTAEIYDKNDFPTIDKTVSGDVDGTVQVGEVLTYTIKGKVPSTTGYKTYKYVITDKMTAGLDYQEGKLEVKIVDPQNGSTLKTLTVENGDYTLSESDNGFVLTVTVLKNLEDYVGKDIVVTYEAKVTEDALVIITEPDSANPEHGKNTAKLEYSNNPADETSTETDDGNTVTVHSVNIVIDKYEKDNDSKKLAGAKFVLKNSEGKYYKPITDGDTLTSVEWVTLEEGHSVSELPAECVVETDEFGAAKFEGLENGTYSLVETEAPDGYNLMTSEQDVTVDGSAELKDNVYQVTAGVANSTGTNLPDTGGIGTTIFTVVGSVLMIGAAVLFVTKKRSEA